MVYSRTAIVLVSLVMAILAFIALGFIISAFIGVLLGIVIHHMSTDGLVTDGGRKPNVLHRAVRISSVKCSLVID